MSIGFLSVGVLDLYDICSALGSRRSYAVQWPHVAGRRRTNQLTCCPAALAPCRPEDNAQIVPVIGPSSANFIEGLVSGPDRCFGLLLSRYLKSPWRSLQQTLSSRWSWSRDA